MRAVPRRLRPPALIAALALVLAAPALPTPLAPPKPKAPPRLATVAQDVPAAPQANPAAPAPVPQPTTPSTPAVVVEGSGWGHSVGMSQYGALAMALRGRDHRQILAHYYPGTRTALLRGAPPRIRVNLFMLRPVDTSRLALQTTSRDGRPPTRAVSVDLRGPGGPVALPTGQTWELRAAGDGLVLTDAAGRVRVRGPGPALVHYAFTGGNPTLLRLPQLGASVQWGHLEVSLAGGALRPVLVTDVETYLRGVAEVPGRWHAEALKAQAVAARTYALRQVERGVDPACGCHLGTTPDHQVYRGWGHEGSADGARWVAAIAATKGRVVTYRGRLAWTYFSSSHGGHSEHSEHSWAFPNAVPYLRAVRDPWSVDAAAGNPYAVWRRVIPVDRFLAALGVDLRELHRVEVTARTPGGTPVELALHGVDRAGAPAVRRWKGAVKGIAGADLKLRFRAELPSQQIRAITLSTG